MKLKWIALICGLLPIIGVNAAYVVAAGNGHVSSCIPYMEGCTSISSAGRLPPESIIFRVAMIPASIFILIYWQLNYRWFKVMGAEISWRDHSALWLGSIAAVFLVVYTVTLGHTDPLYALQRRIGITLYFGFTFFSQLLTLKSYKHLYMTGKLGGLGKIYKFKFWLCLTLLLLGITQPTLNALFPEEPHHENIIEWNFALLIQLYFVVTFFIWRAKE